MKKYISISKDIIKGKCCQLCGQYFVHPNTESSDLFYKHGYPVVCWDCYDDLTKEEKKDYIKSEVETL